MISRTIYAACASALLSVSVGCGGAADPATTDTSAVAGNSATTTPTASPGIVVIEPWARPADAGKNTAVYVQLENALAESDSLIGVSSEAAERTELHASVMDGATMRMRPMGGVALPSGGRIEFRPMGPHVMLFRLRAPLVVGDSVALTFDFASGRSVAVRAAVRAP